MSKPQIAVVSFPGNNCEVESLRSCKLAGMDAFVFRWNDDRALLKDIDGYFIPGGFSYEDRGRAGMVAGRDDLMKFIAGEAAKGKPVIGNCNGAQILVESGLIPNADSLDMSLARNVSKGSATGFLSEWVWVTPTCKPDRCCTSNWKGIMHMPIAHGEGRFTTKDKDLFAELKKNDQLVFSYCDENGKISEDPVVTPNGSEHAVAGICNPAGNVVALMPHPERTPNGIPYFVSLRKWIEQGTHAQKSAHKSVRKSSPELRLRNPQPLEVFIDTIIVNNEERTVEQAAKRIEPKLKLKQLRYLSLTAEPKEFLSHIANFNPNKERAYIRRGESWSMWNADQKREEPSEGLLTGFSLLRRDEPDTGVGGKVQESGICYVCTGISDKTATNRALLEIFGNPHSSILERIEVV